MASTTIGDPFESRGGRGRGRGGWRGGRGGAPGRGRGRGKEYQDEQNGALDTSSKMMNGGRGKGAGYYGFIPTPTANVGREGTGPIGQCANRGFIPPPSQAGVAPGFYAPTVVGIPFNCVLQGTPQIPAQAATSTQVTIPSPIDAPGIPNGYGGQNRGGRGGRARGGWFKSAKGDYETNNRFDNADAHSEASDGTRGGRGWRGGFTPRGGFRGRGRGGFGAPDRGGRGQGQPWRGGRGGRGRGGTGYGGDSAYGQRVAAPELVIDNLPPARDMRENIVGPAIVELTAPDAAIADKPTKIEDLRCIASYTWDTKRKPTLIAPGSPRIWVDRAMPFKVAFDSGIRMFHEDAFYMENESTLIPLFRAVDVMVLEEESEPSAGENAEAIDWAAVDFVTDRNNLRKLLRWVRERGPTTTIEVSSPAIETSPASPTSEASEGKGGIEAGAAAEWDPRKDFRIDLQLGGANTVLMERWAARAREVIVPPKGGCRANFEQEHTVAAPACENGGGHYRIVQYNIGGLNMVVRFEVDACIPATTTTAGDSEEGEERDISGSDLISGVNTLESAKSPARQSFNNEDEESLWDGGSAAEDWGAGADKGKEDVRNQAPPPQDLSWDFPEDDGSAWGITPDTTQDEEVEMNGELTVVRSGKLLPQSSILELATRSIKYADRTSNEDIFLQLFLTQTPTHIVAIHQNGNFEKIVRQELQSAEFTSLAAMEGIRKSIAHFVELLKEIQSLVKEHGTSGRLSLVCEKGKLELFGLGGEEGRLSDVELERFKSSTET